MNYRHAYHAGNFADVVKHVALVAILTHLLKKDAPFVVIDTHAGRGLYDLSGEAARKTGEAANGIECLRGLPPPLPPSLARYLELVAQSGAEAYPGSPLLAAKMLRAQDRLVAIEKHPDEAAALADLLQPWRRAQVENADGNARLPKLLPPPERRGLILMDPPFEAVDEFQTLAASLRAALRRFAHGNFLIWYPVKSQAAVDAFVGEVLAAGVTKALTMDIAIDAPEGKLARAGLLAINPPFGLDTEMRAVLAQLESALPHARGYIAWRAGG